MNLNKIKGITLIEVLVILTLFIGVILIFLQMDIALEEKQNTRKVGLQINQIVTAFDKRLTIEGKEFSKWSNSQWNGSAEFQNFLKKELIGKENTTCGSSDGWNPSLNFNGLDSNSVEGKEIQNLVEEARKSKLIPCNLWNTLPYKINANAKLNSDANNNISYLNIKFNFNNFDDYKKGFKNFNESFNYAKKQKNTNLITKRDFFYSNGTNKIEFSECVKIKESCNFEIKIMIGSETTDDKKFKIDSSNKFETNLGFAKSIKENDELSCNIWTYDESSNEWSSKQTACGVTGGVSGFKEVALLGENIDAEKVVLKGNCKDYDINFNFLESECGMINKNTIVQLNNENINSNKLITENVYAKEVYTQFLNAKNDSNISNELKIYGKKIKDEESALKTYAPLSPYDVEGLDPDYRNKSAEASLITGELLAESLTIGNELAVQDLKTKNLTIKDKAFTEDANSNKLINLYETQSENFDNGSFSGKADINQQVRVKNNSLFNIVNSQNKSVIAGDINANNIISTGAFETEQLNFRNLFDSKNNIVNLSKSMSFDNLGNAYLYPNGYISGWGALGYLSNSGISAKTFKVNGKMVINSPNELLPFGTYGTANFIQNHSSYRNGLTLFHNYPEARAMFTMNEYGRVLVSAYYHTGLKSGLRIGGNSNNKGFFWGRSLNNLTNFNDKPMYTNLSSSIYGYKPGDNITSINNGFKMIMNNFDIYLSQGTGAMNLYSGAYFHKSMPKRFDGTPMPINFITMPLGSYWETADDIRLRHLDSNIIYYLNKISYIYGLYKQLNKKDTISGEKGNRGERGETGIAGDRGETGVQGIPGLVGDRGGL